MKPTNVRQFFKQFPDDEACLAHLFDVRFGQGHTCPKCERSARWYPIKAEKAFSCQWCGHHIHPMVGTIFEKSRTPLQTWFYVMFLFTTTRHGVSAKEIQRQTGVTYKTAYRMGTLCRKHMAAIDGDDPLGGAGKVVEVDESYFGGKGTGKDKKTIVLGIMERDGKVLAKVVPNASMRSLTIGVAGNVKDKSIIDADMNRSYDGLSRRYDLRRVNKEEGYVGPNGECVNAIENFWRHLKCSIKGTHTSVSPEYLERYIKEFEYRFNRRMTPETMLSELLSRFPELNA